MRIGICGTHCAGKTTLANAIAATYAIPLVEEIAARFAEADRQSLETQRAIMDAQIAAEHAAGEHFVSDRTVLDNHAYFVWHATRLLAPGDRFARILGAEARVMAHLVDRPYDLVIFVDEYFLPEDNGVRSTDVVQQVAIYRHIVEHLPYFAAVCRLPHVMTVRGDNDTRMIQIGREIAAIQARSAEVPAS